MEWNAKIQFLFTLGNKLVNYLLSHLLYFNYFFPLFIEYTYTYIIYDFKIWSSINKSKAKIFKIIITTGKNEQTRERERERSQL